MIIQSFNKKQQIVYEDDDLEKVIVLQPIQANNRSQNTLILRFVLEKTIMCNKKFRIFNHNSSTVSSQWLALHWTMDLWDKL